MSASILFFRILSARCVIGEDDACLQPSQETADVIHVIGNAKTAPNQIGNTGIRPSIAWVSVSRGSAKKQVGELLSITKR